jgi:aryl-alcohol dehydrogenase-like predicted oxidoreductase
MKTFKLGNTGIDVSALCLGAMFFGTRNDKTTSYQMLDSYFAAGGRFIDTANMYAYWVSGFKGGESETLLGEWMKARGNRSQVFLATKVGFQYTGVERNLRAKVIEEECHKSLRRLGVETIDLYYAHVDDYTTPLEETLEAFDKLVKAGKVRFVGASNYRAWRLERAKRLCETHSWAQFCCIQQRYTYLRPRHGTKFGLQLVVDEELLDYSRENQFPILAYSVLLGGSYTRNQPLPEQYVGQDSEARLAVLRDVASETGATLNQIVLAWMLHSQPPIIPLIAASTPEQMQDNLDALNVSLNDEQMQRLNSAGA